MASEINDQDFEKEVLNSDKPVLIDFWAEWCGPCRQLGPIVNEVAKELESQVKVVKMNIDNNTDTPAKLGIRSIPTLMLFKDGKAVSTKVGSLPKSILLEWVDSFISQK